MNFKKHKLRVKNLPTNLQTDADVLSYFRNTQNSYTRFLLKKETEKKWENSNKKFEIHHKIPKYANGPDVPANLIPLSHEDHAFAHKLLFENYGNYYDLCAYKMRLGLSEEAHVALHKGRIQQMYEKGQGRFNSSNQRKCGLQNKGVQKQPHTRNPFIKKAFQNGMFWINKETLEIVEIPAGSMVSVQQLTECLLYAFSEEQKNAFQIKGTKSYVYCGINRILAGERNKKTNKALFAIGPWRLGGIFIS